MAVDGKKSGKDQVNDKKGFFKFLKEVKAETKRITWPSKKEVKKAAIAVATFCIMYIVFIGGIDMIFQNLFKTVFGIK
ncbi:preprotein translocase subunit SecE [Clostridium hydrogeniformans]|uniref:preprotein translocase subunit SecE n=1 Tax=Clostridium hydrogeniformans TaxID=349933 RepID=UPI00047F5696|nr:preprotein translocase subunit SecE [Clostridium hydrogeniformans]